MKAVDYLNESNTFNNADIVSTSVVADPRRVSRQRPAVPGPSHGQRRMTRLLPLDAKPLSIANIRKNPFPVLEVRVAQSGG